MSHPRQYAGGESFALELIAQPSDEAPAHRRLRMALKTLGRAYQLRCVAVRETTPPLPATPTPSPAATQAVEAADTPSEPSGGL